MRIKLYIILNLTFVSSFCQKINFIDTNDKTINNYLTLSEGFVLQAPRTENNYKVYSSIKKSEKSYFVHEVYFTNEYPIYHIFSFYQRFDKSNELVKELKNELTKSLFNEEVENVKNRNIEFEKLTDTEFTTKKINQNGILYVEKAIIGENNEYYLFNRENYDVLDFRPFKSLNNENSENYLSRMFKVSTYNIEDMILLFIKDLKEQLKDFAIINSGKIDLKKISLLETNLDKLLIKATFEEMDDSTLAISYGINNDKNVFVKVNPTNWTEASNQKKWYVIYHELGHDILNLNHGEGDKMMFNFVDKKYTWQDFFEDRKKMFNIYFNKKLISNTTLQKK